jgi:hypothetical protein
MIEGKELLSVPFMSEDTKFSTKGDLLTYKLKIDLVNERLFKKYVSRRVSCRIFFNIKTIGRGTDRDVSKPDSE